MLPREPRLSRWFLPGHPKPAKQRLWLRQRRESSDGSVERFCHSGHWSSELQSTFLSRHNRVISWVAPLQPTRGTAARRNSFNQCQGGRVCSAGPGRTEDRTGRTKLEIPFGHAFDRREVSSLPDCPGYGRGKRRRAVCLDERRWIVDSWRDPRTYFPPRRRAARGDRVRESVANSAVRLRLGASC